MTQPHNTRAQVVYVTDCGRARVYSVYWVGWVAGGRVRECACGCTCSCGRVRVCVCTCGCVCLRPVAVRACGLAVTFARVHTPVRACSRVHVHACGIARVVRVRVTIYTSSYVCACARVHVRVYICVRSCAVVND